MLIRHGGGGRDDARRTATVPDTGPGRGPADECVQAEKGEPRQHLISRYPRTLRHSRGTTRHQGSLTLA
ncbi:hypothetical protein E2C01_045278 [Portunus trituberculatus]|uniref:Uncharacterized protein n=1 Tax=Portunus trituberculatus TaxID=210409 RepID=A0A5B7G2F0_PORTR|nr:hypothetical protein [Portunus trituberculatus]